MQIYQHAVPQYVATAVHLVRRVCQQYLRIKLHKVTYVPGNKKDVAYLGLLILYITLTGGLQQLYNSVNRVSLYLSLHLISYGPEVITVQPSTVVLQRIPPELACVLERLHHAIDVLFRMPREPSVADIQKRLTYMEIVAVQKAVGYHVVAPAVMLYGYMCLAVVTFVPKVNKRLTYITCELTAGMCILFVYNARIYSVRICIAHPQATLSRFSSYN
ncbi:unnamed protein product [Dicrocoelium dendriticum]|nr:unnamed protein product [Dicrocoelium dendriticum]